MTWRDGKTTAERGYGSRWQTARKTFLSRPQNALCVMCKDKGIIRAATVVDHKVPHKGDSALFWNTANWQPLCKRCHDGDKQYVERNGHAKQSIGPDGWPIKPASASPAAPKGEDRARGGPFESSGRFYS